MIPRNVERQQKAALQSYANRAYQVTRRVHIFKSHYLYFTKQTVSCGIAPKNTPSSSVTVTLVGWCASKEEVSKLVFDVKNKTFSEGG